MSGSPDDVEAATEREMLQALAELGFQRRGNPDHPHLARAYEREQAWQECHGTLGDPKMCKRFRHYEPAKMIAYTFAEARGPALDTAVDMSCFFLYLDRVIDDLCWDQPARARPLLQQIVDVLDDESHPEEPQEKAVSMFAQVWKASTPGMSWQWRHRATRNWMDYLWANLTETYQRHTGTAPTDLGAFLPMRRLSGGPMPTLDLYEPTYGFEVPASAWFHPHLARMLTLTCDLCVLGNDLASYQREDAAGDAFNAVLLLRDHHGMTVREACRHLTGILSDSADQYRHLRAELRQVCQTLGLDTSAINAVQQWSHCLDDWNGGFFEWQFEPIRRAVY